MKSSPVATSWAIAGCGLTEFEQCKQSALCTQPRLYYEGGSRCASADMKMVGTVKMSAMVRVDKFNNVSGGAFIVHSTIPPRL